MTECNRNHDREHIVQLGDHERQALLEWLARPNGSHVVVGKRVIFEAVVGGGILVRTQPYRYPGP